MIYLKLKNNNYMERKDELTILVKKTEYTQDYAPEVLESFVN